MHPRRKELHFIVPNTKKVIKKEGKKKEGNSNLTQSDVSGAKHCVCLH